MLPHRPLHINSLMLLCFATHPSARTRFLNLLGQSKHFHWLPSRWIRFEWGWTSGWIEVGTRLTEVGILSAEYSLLGSIKLVSVLPNRCWKGSYSWSSFSSRVEISKKSSLHDVYKQCIVLSGKWAYLEAGSRNCKADGWDRLSPAPWTTPPWAWYSKYWFIVAVEKGSPEYMLPLLQRQWREVSFLRGILDANLPNL